MLYASTRLILCRIDADHLPAYNITPAYSNEFFAILHHFAQFYSPNGLTMRFGKGLLNGVFVIFLQIFPVFDFDLLTNGVNALLHDRTHQRIKLC